MATTTSLLSDATNLNSSLTTNTDANFNSNGVRAITGLKANAVVSAVFNGIINLIRTLINSAFNKETDTTTDINEGGERKFCTPQTFADRLAASTTNGLPEGSNNLYFTNSRTDARIETLRPTQTVSMPSFSSGTTVNLIATDGSANYNVTPFQLIDTEARQSIINIKNALVAAKILNP